MNLRQQLSLGISALLVVMFGAMAVIDARSSRSYLEAQLGRTAQDSATSLALAMQARVDGQPDVAMLRTLSDALFDRGLYRSLRLTAADGVVWVERTDRSVVDGVPGWFQAAFSLAPKEGVAEVGDGWRTLALVQLTPHTGPAMQALYDRFLTLALTLVCLAVLATALVYGFVGRALVPLNRIKEHARDWALGSFVQLPETNVAEVKPLVDGLNRAGAALATLFQQLDSDLSRARATLERDTVTGLYNRDAFFLRVRASLDDETQTAEGLVVIQLQKLAELNQKLGRHDVDKWLNEFSALLQDQASGALVGRLNGSDFGLFYERCTADWEVELQALFERLVSRVPGGIQDAIRASYLEVSPNAALTELLERLDRALLERPGLSCATEGDVMVGGQTQWLARLESLWSAGTPFFKPYPVVSVDMQPEYQLLTARLKDEQGTAVLAASFIPMLERSHRLKELDESATQAAIDHAARTRRAVGISLSRDALEHPHRLGQYLSRLSLASLRVTVEVAEADLLAAESHWDALQPHLNGRVPWVLKRAGLTGATPELVRRFRPYAVKFAAPLIERAMHQEADADFVRTTSHLVKSLECKVWVEGVTNLPLWQWAVQNGFEGGQGPFLGNT